MSPPGIRKNLCNTVFGKWVEIYAFVWKILLENLSYAIEFQTNVTTSGQEKSCEVSFWWMSRNLCTFMKISLENFS